MKPVFKKGHIKKGGRKKGTPNKVTQDMRELAKQFSEDNWASIQTDFESLNSPKDKLFFRLAMLEFAIGKMQRVEMKAELQAEIVTTTYVLPDGSTVEV